MLNMEISKLNEIDLSQLTDLYYDCFKDDHYYIQYYGKENIKNTICNHFRNIFLFLLQQGMCYGIKYNNKLIAFILCFDYNYIKQTNSAGFYSIFDCISEDTLLYKKEIHDKLDKNKQYLYEVAIGVKPEYRRQGLASKLIDYIITEYRQFNIVSDISNEESLNIYKRRNFDIEKIDENYYFIELKR